ncbi:MAG: hypothetical protein ACLPSF_13085 [Methylocella sp.]
MISKKLSIAISCIAIAASATLAQAAPILPFGPATVSTVPSNGDVNPYGVAFAPSTVPTNGVLQPGDILVSNYNNSANLQGTGRTIVRIDKHGKVSTFFKSSSYQGLTGALGILSNGIVLVGALPTADGTAATVQPGAILVIDHNGALIATLNNKAFVNGPWGMAVQELNPGFAHIYYTNVLDGTVKRLHISYTANSVGVLGVHPIGAGLSHRLDPAALVLGPSGVTYDATHDLLYVADSATNAIYSIAKASNLSSPATAQLVYSDNVHLHGPLDLGLLPNGDLVVANSDGSNVDPKQPSELVEFTTTGKFVAQQSVDPNNGGAFGFSFVALGPDAIKFAAVDDNQNSLTSWTSFWKP